MLYKRKAYSVREDTRKESAMVKVCIIGTGWNGLVVAKTYMEMDASAKVTMIDEDSTIGGVWSRSRTHPGMIADSPVDLFEFSDLRMSASLGIDSWADIPSIKVHEYLSK